MLIACTSAAYTTARKVLTLEYSGEDGKNVQHVDNPSIF